MSVYVGLKRGKVHESTEISEYYCGRCGYPVTDHDSYCRECGGAFQKGLEAELTCASYCPDCGAKVVNDGR